MKDRADLILKNEGTSTAPRFSPSPHMKISSTGLLVIIFSESYI